MLIKSLLDEKNNKRCKLYLNQENKVNKYYSLKKRNFKNYIDENINKFKNNYQKLKLFCSISSMYSENILKNIENIKKLLSNFDSIKKDLEENEPLCQLQKIIVSQLDGEKEKIERLIFDKDFKKGKPEYEKKGKEISNQLYKYYHDYINSLDKLNSSHTTYLRSFNDYETKMIKNETKDIKDVKEKYENTMPKSDPILLSLHSTESQYQKTIEIVNQNVKNIYTEVNQNLEEVNKINNEINEIIESSIASIYLGYVTSNKIQKVYDKKIFTLKKFKTENTEDLENIDNEEKICEKF